MFAPGWYAIADTDEVPRDRPVGLERFGQRLVVFRGVDGAVAVLDDRCPHRGASLALGVVREGRVACPFHGFEFDASGACARLPVLGEGARGPRAMCARAHEAREQDGWLFVWWGDRPRGAGDPAAPPRFAVLDGRFARSTLAQEWPASMARVIENQLDPFHLPFVHATTIGKGMPPAMTVRYSATDERLRAWTGDDLERDEPFYIELRPPNLWLNRISTRFSIVAAFAPIDATRTRTYLRTYQSFVTWPGLRWVAGKAFDWANRRIFAQDRRVVVSQPQGWPEPGDEVLVKADGPIIAYRRWVEAAVRGGPTHPDAGDERDVGDEHGDGGERHDASRLPAGRGAATTRR